MPILKKFLHKNAIDKKYTLQYFAVLLIAIFLIIFYTLNESKKMRHDMLQHALIASASIDTTTLSLLTAKPGDINLPEYRALKHQLIRLKKQISNCQYIYILRKIENDLYFLVNARDLQREIKNPSLIGEKYSNHDKSYLKPFVNNEPLIIGPVHDEYGKTMSLLVPLKNNDSTYLFAVDIKISEWYLTYFKNIFLPVLAIILLTVIIIGYLTMKHKLFFIVDKKNIEMIKSREVLSSTIQSIGDGFITTDTKGIITNINIAAQNLLRIKNDGIIGRRLNTIFHLVDSVTNEPIDNLHKTIIENPEEYTRIDNVVLVAGNKNIIISISASKIHYEQEIIGCVIVFKDISQLYNLQKQLIESEEKLKSIIQNAPIFIATIDPDNVFTFIEGNILKQLKINRNSIIFKTTDAVFPAGSDFQKNLGLAQQGETVSFTTIYRDFYLKINLSPIYEHENTIAAVLCVGYDITENIKTEITLRESEETFRALTENSEDTIMRFNKNFQHLYANPATENLTGIPAYKFLGKTHQELGFPAELWQNWEKAIQEVFDTGKTKRMEFELQNDKWVDWILMPEFDDDRKVKAVITSARDISGIKSTEKQLNFLQVYLSNIIDSMPSVIIGIDIDGKINLWNKEIERQTGLKPEAVINKKADDIFEKYNLNPEIIKNSILKNEQKKLLKKEIHTENKIAYIDIIIYPLSLPDSQSAIIRIDDVTEQVHVEQMLIQSEKMLSLGGLAAGMAHEINNPIAGMIQNCDLLVNRLTKKLPKNIQAAEECMIDFDRLQKFLEKRNIIKTLRMIHTSGQNAAKIVQNMLDFASKRQSSKSNYDIAEIIESAIKLVKTDFNLTSKYDFKKIKILRNYATGENIINCNKDQIQQVFLNILKNGAEAMNEYNSTKEPVFEISVIKNTKNLIVEIADNGPGIPEEKTKYIFDPFYTTKSPQEATGLGLSISFFIIVQNHGGEIYIDETRQQGTKFIIKLPLVKNGDNLSDT